MNENLIQFFKQELDKKFMPRNCMDFPTVFTNKGKEVEFFSFWHTIPLTIICDNADIFLQDQFIKWCEWIEQNLYSEKTLNTWNSNTGLVLIRIGTGMLNKLDIPEDIKRIVHNSFVNSYLEVKRVATDYHYRKELGIPF